MIKDFSRSHIKEFTRQDQEARWMHARRKGDFDIGVGDIRVGRRKPEGNGAARVPKRKSLAVWIEVVISRLDIVR